MVLYDPASDDAPVLAGDPYHYGAAGCLGIPSSAALLGDPAGSRPWPRVVDHLRLQGRARLRSGTGLQEPHQDNPTRTVLLGRERSALGLEAELSARREAARSLVNPLQAKVAAYTDLAVGDLLEIRAPHGTSEPLKVPDDMVAPKAIQETVHYAGQRTGVLPAILVQDC